MSIYSFLIAVRSGGEMLTNEDGETTSHLMGMFYRTLRIVDNGIKPIYVSMVRHRSSSLGSWQSAFNARQQQPKV